MNIENILKGNGQSGAQVNIERLKHPENGCYIFHASINDCLAFTGSTSDEVEKKVVSALENAGSKYFVIYE